MGISFRTSFVIKVSNRISELSDTIFIKLSFITYKAHVNRKRRIGYAWLSYLLVILHQKAQQNVIGDDSFFV